MLAGTGTDPAPVPVSEMTNKSEGSGTVFFDAAGFLLLVA